MKSSVFKKENILKKIIMVSTNNTCRSFIAESILRQYLLDADQKNVEVISRGLVVLFPEPVHVKAADMVIKTCGIESLDFRSAQLTQEEVEESDLILTMTEEQKDKILEEYHGYKEIATLNEYARVEGAIIDPYGMEDDDYERCFEQIARLVKKIWQERLGGNKMIGIGSDKGQWSEYSENSVKEFTGLHEGKYVFSVKLMTDKDQELVITSFAFEVLPPWYRAWWSYLIYAVMLSGLLYYIYYRIADSRKRLLMQKELELYRQKQEFKKESELKDKKIDILKEENLQSELRYKSEELIRTTLNIVRKNEILLDIKREVLGISHSISEENLVSLRRKTLRLLGQIDTNIEHDDDLQAFQSTFDSVHHDFFRKLEKAYPELNNKDKLLCAYIQMNLLSKEIAPLLNISLRGVEISRYRLRKKLGVEEGENLAEFLQKFSK